jgi:FkbM family methyltransferase
VQNREKRPAACRISVVTAGHPETADRLITLTSGLRLLVAPDDGLASAMADEAYESAELLCARHMVSTADVVIDAGAHAGWYALPLAVAVGSAGRVYAFEPLAASAARLRRAATLNRLESTLLVHEQALADVSAPGRLRVCRAPSAAPAAALDRQADDAPVGSDHVRVRVDVVALDTLAVQGRISLIKLDVEGAEWLALRGAAARLQRDRPALLCEVDYAQLRRVSGVTPDVLFAWLRDRGYTPHGIAFDGTPGPALEHPPTEPVSSVLFLPTP